jgi:uncharacterized protein (TIGR02231 family)
MKRILSCLLISLSFNAIAQKEVNVNSNIKEVTVFLKGAQITREATLALTSGTNYLVFNNLSSNLNPNSIQIQGNKNISILSVNHIQKQFSDDEFTGDLKLVNDSLENVNFKLGLREGLKTVYAEEQSMILANKSLKGENTGVNIEDLMELSDFYRIRLKDIQYKIVELNIEIKDLQKEQKKLNKRFNDLKQNRQAGASKIKLALSSKLPLNTTIRISYLVYNASWKPDYDIRANQINEPLELVYRGNIKQNTGNDWNNVNLKLSTGNPTINGSLPSLNTWYVDMQSNQPIALRGARSSEMKMETVSYVANKPTMELDDMDGPAVSKQQAAVSNIFSISIPYSVPSDNKAYTVELQKNELQAEFNYFAVPKLDQHVYLLAQVTGWESLNLLAGNTNIYYRGTYVGRSYIDPSLGQDTLNLSMGADPEVVVNKEVVNDYKKKRGLANENKITYSYVITSKNNKSSSINLIVEDQIPVSKNKGVQVELINSSNATYNAVTGKLTWEIKLDSGTSKNTKLSFSLTYPKDQNIIFR